MLSTATRSLHIDTFVRKQGIDWPEVTGNRCVPTGNLRNICPSDLATCIRAGAALLSLIFGGLKVTFASIAAVLYRIDMRAPYKKGGFPKNYVVIAVKEKASVRKHR